MRAVRCCLIKTTWKSIQEIMTVMVNCTRCMPQGMKVAWEVVEKKVQQGGRSIREGIMG